MSGQLLHRGRSSSSRSHDSCSTWRSSGWFSRGVAAPICGSAARGEPLKEYTKMRIVDLYANGLSSQCLCSRLRNSLSHFYVSVVGCTLPEKPKSEPQPRTPSCARSNRFGPQSSQLCASGCASGYKSASTRCDTDMK